MANPTDDYSLSVDAWRLSERQNAIFYWYVVDQFAVVDLVESIHMLYEQITLNDDTQMTIKLAASMMLLLYSSVRSDADTALALLQIGTRCLPLDPESSGEEAIEMKIAAPIRRPGHARAWLYSEMMATEDAKDRAYIRGGVL